MPAATDKSALLAVTQKDFAKLDKLIETIPDDVAMTKLDEDTSIKDTIGHRAYWIGLFLGWYEDGIAGREVHIPAKGYKWNQLKELNASVRAEQSDLGWQTAKGLLRSNHARLIGRIEGLSDDDLYGHPMTGNDKWTAGRFAEASGASHYRSAAKFIRSGLRQLGH